jgi:two-component system OmpR family response regulator
LHRLALVDDDNEIRTLLSDYLTKNGFEVRAYESAEALLEDGVVDNELLILDVTLPGMDGLALCRQVRNNLSVPIIMLTAASDDVDRILGLELGADDYMGKPFNPRELLARVKALLRRAVPTVTPLNSTREAPLVLDTVARTARFAGTELTLTGAEFDLLKVLLDHRGEIVSRDQLSTQLKGHPSAPYDRSIDTQVSRLRTKLSAVSNDDPIKSIRGKGYQLVLA